MRQITTCDHVRAEAVSTTKGEQLPDGRWRFSQRFHCPDCGRYFDEKHIQIRPPEDPERRAHPRPTGPIEDRIDRMWSKLRGIEQSIEPFKRPKTEP
jgi:hypothetical protein